MSKIHKFHSDAEIAKQIARNKHITDEDLCKTFGRPIFVYGTLLTGFGNYRRLLEGHTTKIVEAKLYGHSISSGGSFPFMSKVKSGTPVIGELVYLPDAEYLKILERLDWLEGAGTGFYNRSKVRVVTKDGVRIAWAYTCDRYYDPSKRIRSGSWRKHTEEVKMK